MKIKTILMRYMLFTGIAVAVVEANSKTRIAKRNLIKKKKKSVKRHLKTKTSAAASKKIEGPSKYVIYIIVNTGYFMNKGNVAASVARGLLGLYNKVDSNNIKSKALDKWENCGEHLVVLSGSNHNHLMFLKDDVHFASVETYMLYKAWGKSQIALTLSILGEEESLESSLEGLSHYK